MKEETKIGLFVSLSLFSVFFLFLSLIMDLGGGGGSSFGIATHYPLDGPGIQSRFGARLPATFQTGSFFHPASYTMGIVYLSGGKEGRAGRGFDRPPI